MYSHHWLWQWSAFWDAELCYSQPGSAPVRYCMIERMNEQTKVRMRKGTNKIAQTNEWKTAKKSELLNYLLLLLVFLLALGWSGDLREGVIVWIINREKLPTPYRKKGVWNALTSESVSYLERAGQSKAAGACEVAWSILSVQQSWIYSWIHWKFWILQQSMIMKAMRMPTYVRTWFMI